MTENERVHKIRDTKGLTQEALSAKLGVTRAAIANIESGKRAVTDQMRRSICREFHVREEWLRTGEGPMEEERSREEELREMIDRLLTGETVEFKARLFRVLCSLDEKQWIFLEQKLYEILDERERARPQPDPAPPAPLTPGEADAEAEYEKSCGYAQAMGLSASSTTAENSA